jgi:hypothetical protein
VAIAHMADVSKVPRTDSIEGGLNIPLLKVVPPWPEVKVIS